MTVQEVAKNVMWRTKTTQQNISDKAGLSGQGAVAMYLKSKSMRVEALLTILNACGYELVARDPKGQYPEYVIGDEIAPVKEEKAEKSEDDRLREMIREVLAEEIGKMAPRGRKNASKD